MEWIDIRDKLPDSKPDCTTKVVFIDIDAGLSPMIGWYDPSEKGGGFYVRDSLHAIRVVCTHYIELPKRPE